MELFSNLPDDLQGVDGMRDATNKQLQLFKTLEPWIQQIVLTCDYSCEYIQLSWRRRCSFRGSHCTLRFCVYGYFDDPEAIEEFPHYRKRGMCSKCKQEEARQAARRQERVDGITRFQQAFHDNDEIGMLENERWCDVDSLYDRCESWEDYMECRYPDDDWDY